jgi:uncharacterized protein
MVDQQLLEILACPETKQQVRLADDGLVRRINAAITAGSLKNREGQPIGEPIQAGLIREDGRFLYPVRDEIPIMLITEGIDLGQFGG